jgi:hypothetical protein
MESPAGSQFNQLVGIGTRTDPVSGETHPWTRFVPNFFNEVEKSFLDNDVYKYFGITIVEAMAMPVNRWYRISESARKMKEKEPPVRDTEGQMLELLKALIILRGEES